MALFRYRCHERITHILRMLQVFQPHNIGFAKSVKSSFNISAENYFLKYPFCTESEERDNNTRFVISAVFSDNTKNGLIENYSPVK